mgnify:CR=1 FL=1
MKAALLMSLLSLSLNVYSQESILQGSAHKIVLVDEFGSRSERPLQQNDDVLITKQGDTYYWSSRNNKPMFRTEAGIYVTYVATDGSGYVRTIGDDYRKQFLATLPDEQLGGFTYVEHLIFELKTLIVYGR